MIRALRVVRRSAVKARTQAANQLQSLLVTAPDELRERLRGLPGDRLVTAAAQLEASGQVATILAASQLALRSVAVRYQQLTAEMSALDQQLGRLVTQAAPALLALPGVGVDTAAALLITAGDNPDRLTSEAAFAHLCGVAPSRRPRARPPATGCTEAATATPTARCGWSPWAGCAGTRAPAPMWSGAPPRARPNRRSSAASSGSSPARSTTSWCRSLQPAGPTTRPVDDQKSVRYTQPTGPGWTHG